MKYERRFEGHLSVDDPRTPLTGAGGATWPTIPPWNWYLYAPAAWGAFTGLRVFGILLINQWGHQYHDELWWDGDSGGPRIYWGRYTRKWIKPADYVHHTFHVHNKWTLDELHLEWHVQPGPANVNLACPTDAAHPPWNGGLGEGAILAQCEWDEWGPPTWPPTVP